MDDNAPRRKIDGQVVRGEIDHTLSIVGSKVVNREYRTGFNIDGDLRALYNGFEFAFGGYGSVTKAVRSSDFGQDPLHPAMRSLTVPGPQHWVVAHDCLHSVEY